MSQDKKFRENSVSILSVQKSSKRNKIQEKIPKNKKKKQNKKKSITQGKKKNNSKKLFDEDYLQNLQDYVKEILIENQKNKELLVEYEATIAYLKDEQEDMMEAIIDLTKNVDNQKKIKKQKKQNHNLITCPKCSTKIDVGKIEQQQIIIFQNF